MSEAATRIEYRRLLRRTWVPFFSRFGRLTPIQALTVPKILAGKNVVVCAPTASGKTEAVVAPVAERFIAEDWDGLGVVYIVPTRALANDSFVRIEGPLSDMGLRTALKHGDRSALPAATPHWLITTPESLDSLICRQPALFSSLRTIIIDEIHLLDNTYRGDQLRMLLWRLQQLISAPSLSIHLLSATLPNAEELAQRYVSEFEVVHVTGQRELNYELVSSHEEVKQLARKNGWKKILYFCNRRSSVEEIATQLTSLWKPHAVVAHHGSLDRKLREEAEQVMKENRTAVCVSTSTLEIGIDIGNIDLVVLAEPPWSISSLLQRIGRGNRRAGKIQAAAIVSTPAERTMLEAMFDAAIAGVYFSEEYNPDISVVVQQTLSVVFQHKTGIRESELVDFLAQFCSAQEASMIVNYLYDKGWLQRRGVRICPTTKLLDEAERGEIHSNIPDQGTFRVIDLDSGLEIGTVTGVFDDIFLLAGRAWKVVSSDYGIVRVRRYSGNASATAFKGRRDVGGFYRLLPTALKR